MSNLSKNFENRFRKFTRTDSFCKNLMKFVKTKKFSKKYSCVSIIGKKMFVRSYLKSDV